MVQPCEWSALVALVTRTLIATTYLDWHLVVDNTAVRLGIVTIHPTRAARRVQAVGRLEADNGRHDDRSV